MIPHPNIISALNRVIEVATKIASEAPTTRARTATYCLVPLASIDELRDALDAAEVDW